MKKIIVTLSAISLSMAGLSGCANMNETQRDTGMGAGIGAIAGGLIGAATAGGNKGKSAATGAAIGAALGAGGGYLWSQNMQKQRAEMEQATAGTGIGISQTTDNQLKVDIPADVSFDVGRYAIKPNMRPVLDRLASTLNQHPVTTVTIVGHTDSTGSDAVNDPLSINRAASTRDYLVQRGVSAQRIAVDGRGSRQPVADNSTASGRAMNRRVEIFIAEPAR
ncbi:OmpA family protein [Thauera sp.]|jgi:outer membrane protein OmpA-like peptidoglycan-associated protein|uniref:OmpA family protein n=1 Tax=Thauera sp. TaxID=1905334 RepID=UPI002A359FBA|nr:OmpA family protein [Thauera sp.]MDX9886773.1 OmpA family protein [Thauera sp.]